MKRSRFDIEYTKWLQQVDVEKDDDVWNEIEDELDFIETWDNISVKLDVIKPQTGRVFRMRYLKVIAAIAAIILIMFLPVRYLIEQVNQPTIISERSNEVDGMEEPLSEELLSEELLSEGPIPLKAANDEEEIVQRIVAEVSPANNTHEKTLASFSSNELMPIIESKDTESTSYSSEVRDLPRIKTLLFDPDILKASIDTIPTTSLEPELNLISESVKSSSEISKSSGISFRVAEVGLVYSYKNTWLLNYETRNGLNPKKLGNTLPTFHQDIGVSSSFELNNRYLFGMEFLWKSGAGQNYQQYINASFVERNINLNYLKLQAFYLWDNNRFPGQATVGGYIAKLTMARELVDIIKLSVYDNYSNLDYGLLAGYQLNIPLKNRIIIKSGIRVNYNLVNIFEGDDITPSHFKKTKNLAASFNISLSYRFFK